MPTNADLQARRLERARGFGQRLARIYINAGRVAGVGPKDLVGAIANEAGIPGRDIGGIEVTDQFSLVDVPEEALEHVIECLNGSRLRGRRINVRRDRLDEGNR